MVRYVKEARQARDKFIVNLQLELTNCCMCAVFVDFAVSSVMHNAERHVCAYRIGSVVAQPRLLCLAARSHRGVT
jgi:hypothetical protein